MVATWGVVGVLLLLSQAIWRLGGLSLEAYRMELSPLHWGVLGLWTAMNAYAEGYRAFQKRFSPRVVVRAFHLARHPKPLHALLAPAYCMALFHASRRAKRVAWGTVIMVLGFIFLLKYVPQPWRGIIDAGVVVALVWGALAIAVFYVAALGGKVPDVPKALPEADNADETSGLADSSSTSLTDEAAKG